MKKILSLFLFVAIAATTMAQSLNVASFNVRYRNDHDAQQGNGWATRFPVICELIRYNSFDVIGAQEVMKSQLDDILAAMPEYAYVGVGREDGKDAGEFSALFYKKDMFKLLNSGTFWLSENTDYPNVGWDAALTRVCSWAKLKDKKSGFEFWAFNVHQDHVGVNARYESAKLLLRKIGEMCGKEPVVLTGDFNVNQHSDSYKVLAESGVLFDAYETAEIKYALNGTFNAFDPNSFTSGRIDHVFVSKDFAVKRYAVLTDTYRTYEDGEGAPSPNFPKEERLQKGVARVPSDHFPVRVDLGYGRRK